MSEWVSAGSMDLTCHVFYGFMRGVFGAVMLNTVDMVACFGKGFLRYSSDDVDVLKSALVKVLLNTVP